MPRGEEKNPTLGWAVWVAQGFGAGRLPAAPGTFGSLVGIGWLALLLSARSLALFLAGAIALACVAIPLCGAAERRLGQKDPPSVVLDEIAAVPICWFIWVIRRWLDTGQMPGPLFFFKPGHWGVLLGFWAAFRAFDIWKPWPIARAQSLPGGWGIVIDDLLAAGYVNLAGWIVALLERWFGN